jgi:hypothetical protein
MLYRPRETRSIKIGEPMLLFRMKRDKEIPVATMLLEQLNREDLFDMDIALEPGDVLELDIPIGKERHLLAFCYERYQGWQVHKLWEFIGDSSQFHSIAAGNGLFER